MRVHCAAASKRLLSAKHLHSAQNPLLYFWKSDISAEPLKLIFHLCLCLQESPSNKLLYAKEISSYKKMVDE